MCRITSRAACLAITVTSDSPSLGQPSPYLCCIVLGLTDEAMCYTKDYRYSLYLTVTDSGSGQRGGMTPCECLISADNRPCTSFGPCMSCSAIGELINQVGRTREDTYARYRNEGASSEQDQRRKQAWCSSANKSNRNESCIQTRANNVK